MNLLNDCSIDTGYKYTTTVCMDSDTISLKGGMTAENSTSGVVPSSATVAVRSSRHVDNINEKLRANTVKAMANLLAANIDSGLVHSIGLGYHTDLKVRTAFAEVITKILQQGTEFDTLNETVLADRYSELVKLVTMITDDGELPIASALAAVVQTQQLDELARILVTLFDAKHLLYELLWVSNFVRA